MIKKLIKIIGILYIIQIILMPLICNAANWDELEYGPNGGGMAGYTDKEAEENSKEKEKTPDSSKYVGKSSNNYLKSLKIENATLTPEFNRQYVDYKVELDDQSNRIINIIAEAEDEKATIKGDGNSELREGENKLQVVVTAENGDVQIYDLLVTVKKDETQKEAKEINEENKMEVETENKTVDDKKENIENKNNKVIYIIICGIIVLLIIGNIIKGKKRKR